MSAHCTRPCRLCPFHRKTAPGWLGPWDGEELLHAIQYAPFPCHETIKPGDRTWEESHHRTCAGAAIFLNKKLQLSRAPAMMAAQQALRDASDEIKQMVFDTPDEFRGFHGIGKRR